MQKWQKQVEGILRKKFPDDDLSVLVKEATTILETEVNPPSGELGEVIGELMREASKGLRPLAAVYLGFQLGVAWERYNAR
ncbi:MAG TPA: hypothetical protein VMW64_08890 [Dehalococcoidia bacterium]|nr:hypothetical protein [Dehalococcoidia bacterium]